jgi:hypothetical protein
MPQRRWDFSHVPPKDFHRLQRHIFEQLLDKATGQLNPECEDAITLLYGSVEVARDVIYGKQKSIAASRIENLRIWVRQVKSGKTTTAPEI